MDLKFSVTLTIMTVKVNNGSQRMTCVLLCHQGEQSDN